MRSYCDPIDVRRGLVDGQEVPAQFVWRERLWVVREIISHWIETGAWWEQAIDQRGVDLLVERECWRVEARRGRAVHGGGVFDLAYGQGDGRWHLVCAFD